ncbi:YodC family protein [Stappia indica]|uniref:DUF2158 domain-containing protein n=1 Tax=Stappia indica TaxID=538381 RepID=A0A857CC36_9HYPH|nr:DUF2158 domain-containing protein [Stappia indica]
MFSVGDKVHLKSGSPDMTVEAVDGDSVHCVWFSGMNPVRDTFKVASLSKKGGDNWDTPGGKILD